METKVVEDGVCKNMSNNNNNVDNLLDHGAAAITTTDDNVEFPKPYRKKRKRSVLHAVRMALFMIGRRSNKKTALRVNDGSKSIWRRIVGSMRPLHLQGGSSNENKSPRGPVSDSPMSNHTDMNSMVTAEEESNSPSPPSTRYASAIGLNELVHSSDDENEKQKEVMILEDECDDDSDDDEDEKEEVYFNGDEKIDDKAEEFIAMFYKQMNLQRVSSVDRRYNERNERSLGL